MTAQRAAHAGAPPVRAACPACRAAVLVDARALALGPQYATVRCPECSAAVPVPRTDALRAEQDQILERLSALLQTRRSIFHRWRGVQLGPPSR
jgi:predicted Zn finger-like uncharacterized protein